ncbi:MAG: ATP-dependent metallopeptidase FtsH/Yme1/Tma family protein, partial [Lachnospiraceae bacterium]|nr:ATP-dependent metallopeptidase FtsH/Yme1/Tma family protein [Lachnospiraceae bacterium]
MADNDYNYNQDDRNNGSGGNNNGKSPWPMVIAILLGGALLIFIASRMFSNVGSFFSEEITYNEFLKYLQEDRVEKVVLQD